MKDEKKKSCKGNETDDLAKFSWLTRGKCCTETEMNKLYKTFNELSSTHALNKTDF